MKGVMDWSYSHKPEGLNLDVDPDAINIIQVSEWSSTDMLSLSGVHSASNVEFARRDKQTESEHTDNLKAITESPLL